MMKKKGIILFLSLAFTLAIRAEEAPRIEDGILDLRGGQLDKVGEVSFSGEWEFYWKQFLSHKDFQDSIPPAPKTLIKVPAVWNSITIDGEKLPQKGFGTYRIRVLLDTVSEPLAIRFGSISTAFDAYIDGKLINSAGKVSSEERNAKPGYFAGVSIFQAPANCFDIIIHVSNYHYSKGGLWNNITYIGKAEHIQEKWSGELELLLLLLGCITIIALYHIGLFQLNRTFKSAWYFALFCLVMGVRAMVVNEIYILKLWPEFNWILLVKIEYLTLMLGTISFIYFINDIFPSYRERFFCRIVIGLNLAGAFIVVFTAVFFFTKALYFYQFALLLGAGYSVYIIIKALIRRERTAQILIIGMLALFGTIINDMLYVSRVVNTSYLATYGFMFFIVSQAYMLSYIFQKMFKESRKLAIDLEDINKNLERKVAERTLEIKERNVKLREQNEEITAQRDNIEKQHQVVKHQKQVITDSINYAQRIQRAVLPSNNKFTGHLKDHFIFYKPRDIVSGDFYWFSTSEDKILIVAADCTGHGVPGAFMSMLGMAFLAEISRMPEVKTPAEILEFMREKVKQSLHQYDSNSLQKEGMDMALCMYDPKSKVMEFAGAYSPLYLIRDGEIIIHKGDRQPVAVYLREKEFTNNEIKIRPDDRFYIFSDGYADQTNGKTYKKFMVRKFRQVLVDIHKLPMQEQRIKLETTLDEWQNGGPQIDDILVIGFQV
jgi:serine phosphatase RsbU (regulator of sigma subunit)